MQIFRTLKCMCNRCIKDSIIREEWLPADREHKTERLLRFYECPLCHKTHSTITSPEVEETRYSDPTMFLPNTIRKAEA